MSRWYLRRAGGDIHLIVEDAATSYGVLTRVVSRTEARALLPEMREELVRRLARRHAAVRTYDPQEIPDVKNPAAYAD